MNRTFVLTVKGMITDQYPYQIINPWEVIQYNQIPVEQEEKRFMYLQDLRRFREVMVLDNMVNWDTDTVLHQITW
jgi:hypothetical protein